MAVIYLVRTEVFNRAAELDASPGRNGNIVDDVGEFGLLQDGCVPGKNNNPH